MTAAVQLPRIDRDRARRLRHPLGVAATIGVATLALHFRDPHQHGSWGLCPFKAITGWDCPACGGLRAVNDLGNGQLLDAAHSNLLLIASLPLVVGLWLLWVGRSWTGDDRSRVSMRASRPVVTVAALVAVAFTVYRNTPWGSAWFAA